MSRWEVVRCSIRVEHPFSSGRNSTDTPSSPLPYFVLKLYIYIYYWLLGSRFLKINGIHCCALPLIIFYKNKFRLKASRVQCGLLCVFVLHIILLSGQLN